MLAAQGKWGEPKEPIVTRITISGQMTDQEREATKHAGVLVDVLNPADSKDGDQVYELCQDYGGSITQAVLKGIFGGKLIAVNGIEVRNEPDYYTDENDGLVESP